jgi:hypothetical protein
VVTGIADQRPAWAERLAEVPGQLGGTDELRLSPCPAHAFGELRRQIHSSHEVGLDVSAIRPELLAWPAERDTGQAVMRRECGPSPAVLRANGGLEAADGQLAPVGVVHNEPRGSLVVLLRVDGLGDL